MRTFFPLNGKVMNNQMPHTTSSDPATDAGVMNMLEGMGQFVNGVKLMYGRSVEEKEQLRQQVESKQIEPTNIVADGKQNELIAVLNALYEYGIFTGSKKEFMERMAGALGCPGIADYSAQLYKIKQTYKYSEIFDRLKDTAIKDRDKDN